VHAPDCASFGAEAFVHLLEVELIGEHLRIRRDTGDAGADLSVDIPRDLCDDGTRSIRVTVRAGSTRIELDRAIELGDLPSGARPRTLALAVAELIRESRASKAFEVSAASNEPTRETPLGPPDSSARAIGDAKPHDEPELPAHRPAPDPAPVPRAHRNLEASACARLFAPDRSLLVGVNAAAAFPLRVDGIVLRADVEGSWMRFNDPLGDVDVSLYLAGLAALLATRTRPMFVLGPHVQVGYARASGIAHATANPGAGGRAVLFASLVAGARVDLFSTWKLLAELEGGITLSGLDVAADERVVAALRGGFAALRVGLAFEY
jgi:hypothetical protein